MRTIWDICRCKWTANGALKVWLLFDNFISLSKYLVGFGTNRTSMFGSEHEKVGEPLLWSKRNTHKCTAVSGLLEKRKVAWGPHFQERWLKSYSDRDCDSWTCTVHLWKHSLPMIPYKSICMSYHRVSLMSNYSVSWWNPFALLSTQCVKLKIAWVIVLAIKGVHIQGNFLNCFSLNAASVVAKTPLPSILNWAVKSSMFPLTLISRYEVLWKKWVKTKYIESRWCRIGVDPMIIKWLTSHRAKGNL